VSPSVYETGRVVTLAPWLRGQATRVSWLLRQQNPDGRWGGPGAYGLVPTLSATEALLTTARRLADGKPSTIRGLSTVDRGAVVQAAVRGLSALRTLLRPTDLDLPDMPAIDLIAPALVQEINSHLAADRARPLTGVMPRSRALPSHPRLGGERLARLRASVRAGHLLPDKLVHALEVLGDEARGVRGVMPAVGGTVGASPAATAAWLGSSQPRSASSRHHLDELVGRTGGPVPCGLPITAFERSWVLSELGRAGLLAPARPRDIVSGLAGALRAGAVAAGPGLPADADTTSASLYAMALAGRPHPVDALWAFETPTHFCTWPGEDGASPTVNAHVLEALVTATATPRVDRAVRRVCRWLVDQQHPEGSWSDRWHASPYYATWCCALALARAGAQRASLVRAARWVLDSQRPDGSWGLWAGTAEETAYSVMVLTAAEAAPGHRLPRLAEAITRGNRYLRERVVAKSLPEGPAMWHDKDLYRPDAIIEGAVLAALHGSDRHKG
jgi:hypothetical protein